MNFFFNNLLFRKVRYRRMAQPNFFVFLLGLLNPYPLSWRSKTKEEKKTIGESALQRTGKHKLLDLNVLPIINSYMETPFYFTSEDVKVQIRSIIADGVNGVRLRYPTDLCELSDGCIAVVEYINGGLIRIFHNNALVQSIGRGIIYRLGGICTNSSDQLVVTDQDKHQVHVFNRNGSHVRSFGSKGFGDGQFSYPHGVCVNSAGFILVADWWNHRICGFDSEGKFVYKFGSKGSGKGYLNQPHGVCVDDEDNIYVVEQGNQRVSKFSSSGAFICTFGSYGIDPGQLMVPWNGCVTHDGKYIIVADRGNHRVQVLSGLDGSFIASYENVAEKSMFAYGCIITADGRILVSDFCNNRIHEIRKA
jgi:hypothetical protein